MVNFSKFNSLISMTVYFDTEDKCREAIAQTRWSDGDIICPICGKHHCTKKKDGRYICSHCHHNFSETVGTIFENTKLPLRKWFMAMYLISSHKKGISSHQLAKDIDVTQKTAWYMLQKIRTVLAQENVFLENDVECDEAYIGGQEKYKHESRKTENNQGRSLKTKVPVFGMVQRNGNVVAVKTLDNKSNTLMSLIRDYVKDGSRVYTDEYIGYHSLSESEYRHSVVNHGKKEFVDGDNYTNTIEGFWSQLKRAIFGVYHFVSAKYLQRYVDESVFRYNTRKADESVRFYSVLAKSVRHLNYEMVRMVA